MPVASISRRRPAALACLALGLSTALLSGCALLEGPQPETPERTEAPAPETAPEFVPGGTAEENLPYFTEVLRVFSAGTEPVQGAPIVQAVADAGFDRAAMQVSFDQSKTNLPADNIFVSVRIGSDCLIGQVVAEDRSFVARNEPAVGPAGDICLIGETAPIG
ncbi:DUF6993 domain-containing protein [Leucobacter chromiiresistens]|uniref:DUF6993 domain-containing protein n=1 Tax=Leucobacter chromiiresistens TaxID=1079994 RepID=A0A147EPY1_9MICO|nr:hypothetical protein [Leucobacter chromiiresistens]KTR86612.1 hypothetical protein NS354_04260 [Leucobacter chromiiresistens]